MKICRLFSRPMSESSLQQGHALLIADKQNSTVKKTWILCR